MTTSPARDEKREAALVHAERAVAVSATLIAILLHLRHFARVGALWRDESNTANLVAARSLSELARGLEFESFPALFPILLRGWVGVAGDSDTVLRLAGLVGSLSIVGAIWLAAVRLRFSPVLSLALIAANPGIVRWGSSVRAFGLAAALAVVALVLMALASERESDARWRSIAAAALMGVLSVQCLYQNAILLAAAGFGVTLAALVHRDRRGLVVVAVVGTASAVSLIPYLGTLQRVATWRDVTQSTFPPEFLATRFWYAIAGGGPIPGMAFVLLAGAGIAAGIAAGLSSSRGAPEHRRALVFSGAAAAAVLAFTVFVLRLGLPTQPWYYIGLIAFVAVASEAAIQSSGSRAPRWLAVGAATLVLATGSLSAYRELPVRHTNADAVAALLESHARAGDLIVVSPWYLVFGIERYYHGPASVVTLPPLADTSLHRYDLVRKAMTDPDAIRPLVEAIDTVLQSNHAVFVVGGLRVAPPGWQAPTLPPPPLPQSGWNYLPYLNVWSTQVGTYLRDRAGEADPIAVPFRGGPFEDIALSVHRGSRE